MRFAHHTILLQATLHYIPIVSQAFMSGDGPHWDRQPISVVGANQDSLQLVGFYKEDVRYKEGDEVY